MGRVQTFPTPKSASRGLSGGWLHVRRRVVEVLKEQQTFRLEQNPLIDLYVHALRESHDARAAAELHPYQETESGSIVAHPGWIQSDRAARRAAALAQALMLTPEQQGIVAVKDLPQPPGGAAEPEPPQPDDDQSGL